MCYIKDRIKTESQRLSLLLNQDYIFHVSFNWKDNKIHDFEIKSSNTIYILVNNSEENPSV